MPSKPMPTIKEAQDHLLHRPFMEPKSWAVITGSSLNTTYALLRTGRIPSVRQGQRYLIPSAWARQQAGLPV